MDMEQPSTRTYEPLTPRQLEALHARLNRNRVASRNQGGKSLSYLEGWDVKATLIKVFGYGGFSVECLGAEIIRDHHAPPTPDRDSPQWQMTAKATVRLTIPQLGAVYTEVAIAGGKGSDYTEVADLALKSAETDALKRAAIFLGTQFGLSLYDDGSTANVINVVLAPGQGEIVDDINLKRANTPESKAAADRLQAVMKVHSPTVTEVPAVAVEPTLTEPQAVVNVATVTTPAPVDGAVAKAMENANRVAQELSEAERATRTGPSTNGRKPAARKSTRKAQPTESVTADRQAVARQALADAEQHVGLGDPYAEQNFAMDDEQQMAEDAQ